MEQELTTNEPVRFIREGRDRQAVGIYIGDARLAVFETWRNVALPVVRGVLHQQWHEYQDSLDAALKPMEWITSHVTEGEEAPELIQEAIDTYQSILEDRIDTFKRTDAALRYVVAHGLPTEAQIDAWTQGHVTRG